MYFVKTPRIIKLLNKNLIWDINNTGRKIYLTFDDGPEPAVTPVVLEILKRYNAYATFFCVGEKALKEPSIIEAIRRSGNTIGNHSFSHIRGKRTPLPEFIYDIAKGNDVLKTNFLRPPYGSISSKQIHHLKDQFHIIMWSVLPGDFDKEVSKEKILNRSVKYTKSGSIIVFHDNLNSKEKVLYALPQYIEYFSKLGYTFEALNNNLFH
jgi:peptidoglycan-N-acetylglucosamine deacetylase